MDLVLKDKSVVITGGASNIGRGIVLAFATEGAHITVGDLDDGQAEKVADLARKKGAASVQVIKTDVTDLDQVKAMFKAATDKHGTVDVLVNNVGWDQFMFFTQTTPELWQKIIQINYVGVLNCTKCVLDIMIRFLQTVGPYNNTFVTPSRRRFMKYFAAGDADAAVAEMETLLRRLEKLYLSRVPLKPNEPK